MSRIAFFAENLNPNHSIESQIGFELVQSLADCQHDIKVITTYDDTEVPDFNKRVEVIRPFKKWNFFEVMRLLPQLIQYQPDVIHFNQKPGSTKWLKAFKYLSSSMKVVNNPVVALSYFNVEPDILGSPLKYHHLTYCDLILVPNSLQMQMVTVVPHLPQHQVIEVLPPTVIQPQHTSESNWLTDEFQKILFIPGPLSSHERIQEMLFAYSHFFEGKNQDERPILVFADGYGSMPTFEKLKLKEELFSLGINQWVYILDGLKPSQREALHDAADWVLLSSLNTAGFHVAYEMRRSLHLKKPIVLNSSQAVFDHHPWEHSVNCFVAENNRNGYTELFELLSRCDGGKDSIQAQLELLTEQQLVDAPGNRLSRLYLKVRN